jgi:hypothetical protein
MFIAAAALIGGASLIGGAMASKAQKKGANAAAAAQSTAAQAGIEEQRRQFDAMQTLFKPYVDAGGGALSRQMDLNGMNGAEAQQKAIEAIQMGPEYGSLVQQGEEGILQNAAATGGLRGGNVQASLAKFRPEVLSALINQQYQRLGGLTSMGQASASGQAAAGGAFANNVSTLFGQRGDAQANAALVRGQANANMWGNLASTVGFIAGRGFMQGAPGVRPDASLAAYPGPDLYSTGGSF